MTRPSHELPYAPGTPQLGLFCAAMNGDLALLERMARQLDGGRGHLAEAVQAVKDHGAGALHFAAGCKKAEVCEYLVEDVGVNVDAVDQAGRTPLVCAITADKSGYVNIVRYLLDHGANPDNVDIIGFTPLHEAAKIGNCEILELLLSRGAYVDPFSTAHGTPLHVAAEHKQDAAMKILLDHHADFGCLPIHLAAYFGTRKAVEILFEVTSSRIPAVHDWSVDGIISHVKAEPKFEDLPLSKMSVAELKEEGDKALHKDDYDAALQFYNAAMMLDLENIDAVLIGNRGYCRLLLGRDGALNDAHMCRKMRPDCTDSCWLEGYSYLQVKEYEKACDSFLDGLKLKPGFVGIEKALRQALRLLTESDAHKKNGSEGPAAEYRPVYLYH